VVRLSRNKKLVTAVLLTRNSEKYVRDNIGSLVNDGRRSGVPLEIIVVDGGSTDSTLGILKDLSRDLANLEVIALKKNMGTTMSRNLAIRKSRGEYIFVLDSDTVVLPGAINGLIDALESNSRIGLAAPKLIYPNGEVQISCKKFPTLINKLAKFLPIKFLNDLGQRAETYPECIYSRNNENTPVAHCISAAWMLKREAINDVGFLDESIFYAPEDVDYCARLWLSGWQVIYVPMVSVVHYTQRLSHRRLDMAWLHIKGLFYYFRKYKYLFSPKSLLYQIRRVASAYGVSPPIETCCESSFCGEKHK